MTAPATLMSGVRRVSAWANLALVQSGHHSPGAVTTASVYGEYRETISENLQRRAGVILSQRDLVNNPDQTCRCRIVLYHRQRIRSSAGVFKGSFGRNQPDWERGHINARINARHMILKLCIST